jgi:hypothetical protein
MTKKEQRIRAAALREAAAMVEFGAETGPVDSPANAALARVKGMILSNAAVAEREAREA